LLTRGASLGRLTAAEEAVHQTRELLAGVRSEVAAGQDDPAGSGGPDDPKVPSGS
jgi:hypothetical protein